MKPIKIRNKNEYAKIKEYLTSKKWSKKSQGELENSVKLKDILKKKAKKIEIIKGVKL